MEKFSPDRNKNNIDTSFMRRRQEALADEGVVDRTEHIDSRKTGLDANDSIIEGLRKLNTKQPDAPQGILDMILSHVEQLRADNQHEDAVRQTLDKFLSQHPALLKYFEHPSFAIADLPEHTNQTYDRYNF